jgi:hypothetical protein
VDKLAEIMENQSLATVKEVKLTDEEKAHKQAILAHYAQVSDGEEYPFAIIKHSHLSGSTLKHSAVKPVNSNPAK